MQQTIGVVMQLFGYVGMILFPLKFGFATHLDAYKLMPRWFGFNGYYFWILSWIFVMVGTALTIVPNVSRNFEGFSVPEWIAQIDAIEVFTGIIALFTYLVWRSYRKIEWFTGSMESHSMLQLQLEAAKNSAPSGQAVRVIWWDPDIEPTPRRPEHKKEEQLNEIYLFIPPHLRRKRQKWWRGLWHWFAGA